MNVTLSFFGGAGTVTGSKYLLDTNGRRVLIDCGLFQGFKQLRLRNWAPLPLDPKSIDVVVLTHAHLDHSGYLPVLIRNGFRGSVLCTEATRDLCGILLPDSGLLQEKDAEFANRHGFSKHRPARPLYTLKEAEASLERFVPVDFEQPREILTDVMDFFLQDTSWVRPSWSSFAMGPRSCFQVISGATIARPCRTRRLSAEPTI